MSSVPLISFYKSFTMNTVIAGINKCAVHVFFAMADSSVLPMLRPLPCFSRSLQQVLSVIARFEIVVVLLRCAPLTGPLPYVRSIIT